MTSRTSFVLASTFVAGATAALAACGAEEDADAAPMAASETQPAAGVSCPTRGALTAPEMPAAVAAPAGAQLFYRTFAQGAQIYTCTAPAAGATGGPSWVFKAPQATLYDDRCVEVGSHFVGPTWKITKDGSQVVGKKVADAASPNAGAIPWLLLSGASTSGSGMFGAVTYVNRIDTVGGAAPASGCDVGTVGKEISVPYTATYLFYKAASAPPKSGGTAGYPY